MDHNLIYAGIGSRKTPPEYCRVMTDIARQLSPTGWLLRSGGAAGADLAFERGAVHKQIHLPWDGYNNTRENGTTHIVPDLNKETNPLATQIVDIAARHHPAWDKLSDTVRLFMCRNTTIVLGMDLASYAKMVVCWTENGKLIGGTAHGIKIAHAFDIPVFNIALQEDQVKLCKFVLQYGE